MNNIYSVTDKALYDALNQSQISLSELQGLFLSRGILVSKKTERKNLSKNFSKFTHDYHDHQKIASLLGSSARKEKTTSKIIANVNNRSIILDAANELKVEIADEQDYCDVLTDKTGKIFIHIRYLSTNYGKSDFKQVIKKEAVFELEPSDNGYLVRRPENEQTQNYEDRLMSKIETHFKKFIEDSGGTPSEAVIDYHEIGLFNVESPELRTLFFTKLITELDGFVLDDVSDAYIFHPKPEEIEGESGDTETGVHISKASLKGEGVLKSEELNSLYERGFYIWKIRWRVKENTVDPDIYEFEAQFSDPSTFSGFSYITRGVRKYKGGGEYNKTSQSLSNREELFFNQLIEKTANSIIMGIKKTALGE